MSTIKEREKYDEYEMKDEVLQTQKSTDDITTG